jgi:hypothetical protein
MWLPRCTLKTQRQPGSTRQSLRAARRSARYRPDVSLLEQRALLSTLYAVGSGVGDGTSHLYQIDDYAASPTAVDIGKSGTILTDLAIDPLSDAAYGISYTDLYSVNLNTGKAAEIGALGQSGMDALTFSATGTLYAMSTNSADLYTVNLTSGKATVVFDTGFTASGDLAFETDGSLYLTAPTDLVKIDLSDDTATDVGKMGVTLFGLVVDSSGNMYGGEGNGGSTAIMFSVNTTTGAATEIGAIADASSLGLYGLSFDYPPLPPPPLEGTTTSLQASPLSSVYGQSIALSAAVSPAAGSSGVPTGSVTFYDGTINLGTSPLSGEIATLPVDNLTVGMDAITATYSGDPHFKPSPSSIVDVTVAKDETSVILTPSANPGGVFQPITFEAVVSPLVPGSGTPTGSVTFYHGATDLGTATLVGGAATLPVGGLPAGTDAITASYGGDPDFLEDTSAPLDEAITTGTYFTRTSLATSAKSAGAGQLVTLTATVTPAGPHSGSPAGSVTFMDGTTSLGTLPIHGEKAKLTISSLPLGQDSITVLYPGNSSFAGSVSPMLVETIGQTNTKTRLSSSRKSSTYGHAVNFSATVSASGRGGPVPPGWVTFLDGSTILRMVPLSDGKATFKTSLLSAGTHTIRVVYNGSGGFGSSSASVKQTVKQVKRSIAKSSTTMFGKTGVSS